MKKIFLLTLFITLVYSERYTIQVVAAGKQETIDMMAKKAKAQGFDSVVLQEGNLQKLVVGSYATQAEAKRDLVRAKKIAPTPFIRSIGEMNTQMHASSTKSSSHQAVDLAQTSVAPNETAKASIPAVKPTQASVVPQQVVVAQGSGIATSKDPNQNNTIDISHHGSETTYSDKVSNKTSQIVTPSDYKSLLPVDSIPASMAYVPTQDKCTFNYNCNTININQDLPTVAGCSTVVIRYNCPQ